MINSVDSRTDGNRIAVIRNYEPTRIEHELLAQVFEVVSHRLRHQVSEVDRQPARTTLGFSQVVVDDKTPDTVVPTVVANGHLLEPTA